MVLARDIVLKRTDGSRAGILFKSPCATLYFPVERVKQPLSDCVCVRCVDDKDCFRYHKDDVAELETQVPLPSTKCLRRL